MLRYSFIIRILLKIQICAHHAEVAGTRDTVPLHGNNGAASIGIMKMMGLRKSSKHTALASSEGAGVRSKKVKKIKVSFLWMLTNFNSFCPCD